MQETNTQTDSRRFPVYLDFCFIVLFLFFAVYLHSHLVILWLCSVVLYFMLIVDLFIVVLGFVLGTFLHSFILSLNFLPYVLFLCICLCSLCGF